MSAEKPNRIQSPREPSRLARISGASGADREGKRSTLANAVGLAARGLYVFPVDSPEDAHCSGTPTEKHSSCTVRGKHPRVRWAERATTDPAQIEGMWVEPSNVGVACGPSGLVVIDEDQEGRFEAYANDQGVSIPRTFTVRTGRGRHYYFRAPQGVRIGNSPGDLGEGIDVRGDGGMVVGPGSRHATGTMYEVEIDAEIADLPLWLQRALMPPATAPNAVEHDLPGLIAGPRDGHPGHRHNTLKSYAASLRARSVPLAEAKVLMEARWAACQQPPHCDDEYPLDEALDLLRWTYDTYPAGTSSEEPSRQDLVEREVTWLEVREQAKEQFHARRMNEALIPGPVRLGDFLAEPDVETQYRVEGLWPRSGRVILSAQHKAGKTTMAMNLIRSLADGEKFLDQFPTTQAERIVLIDDEMDQRQLRRWLRDQNIQKAHAVEVISLRGRVGTFDILSEAGRKKWAQVIGRCDVLVIDCLRPILDALGLDENRDAGRFLVALDALLADIGRAEAVLVHHMGHGAERARGDSRILDWPDANWMLVKDPKDQQVRYFSANGRDVHWPESRLEFHDERRGLVLVGGSREDNRARDAEPVVRQILRERPGSGQNEVEQAVREKHPGTPRGSVRLALENLVTSGEVEVTVGPNRKREHRLVATASHN